MIEIIKIASKQKKRVVIGTTGFTKKEENIIKKISKKRLWAGLGQLKTIFLRTSGALGGIREASLRPKRPLGMALGHGNGKQAENSARPGPEGGRIEPAEPEPPPALFIRKVRKEGVAYV